jgi:D-alanyl-D-alanine carboxypeptidase (penicillin-binding protein 5/6)
MNLRLVGALSALIVALNVVPAQSEISTTARHALLMDGQTGELLWQKDGFAAMPPASMSKLMTIELLFQRIKDGRIKLSDTFPVSERAWRERAGSECFVSWPKRSAALSRDLCR